MHLGIRLAKVGAVALLCFSQLASGETFTYPGGAPCQGTLQACIDGAAAGDTVELATHASIMEDLQIAKSLTLRAAEGFLPIIGGGAEEKSVDLCPHLGPETGSTSIEIEGLTFDFARLRCSLGPDRPHRRLALRNNIITFVKNEPGFPALEFTLRSPADIVIEGNVIHFELDHNGVAAVGFDVRDTRADILVENNEIASTGNGIEVAGSNASRLQAIVSRNRITASIPANSGIGIEFDFREGGTYDVAALGNVIHGVGGCNCGRNSGMHVTTPNFTGEAMFTVTNNTIAGNDATGLLAVLQGEGDQTLNVYNNTLSGNAGGGFQLYNYTSNPVAMNGSTNNSFDNGFSDTFLDIAPLTPTAFDPSFVDESNHDYRLRADSQLIDAGTDEPAGGITSIDAEGDLRISGAAIDLGAYEFAVVRPLFFTDRELFLSATQATAASASYSPVSDPPEPFLSGQIMFDAIHPSTLNFGAWPADFPGDNDVELAINDKEDLDIAMAAGFAYAMGIDFDDVSGGTTPSTFEVTVKTGDVQLARFQFETPHASGQNYIGVWAREPFNRLEIRETTTANENEFFGTVSISQALLPRAVFADGFEHIQ
ncbi:right-handed parallel beta-helix repeat-containing protein [Wenzhouxiangella sp. XN201]|uniref:right-handed parallel beta-helix repeat-containing protein n=1 Tax=Wenzhouxiangella sp. XN201 TaxID=2710755 RepID=UPI0013CA22BF|nr:right-handed parallel beta-helix repeat-containing protein [Wenzhouxiangella sp. XN201]NEZ04936.1 right-handed parallel beta-helix repeat-containing protein [Wenzhouxiangella sp. XN201]